MSFTAHAVIFSDEDPAWVRAQFPPGDLSAPLLPEFLQAICTRTGRRVNNIDMLCVTTPLPGPPPLQLTPVAETVAPATVAQRPPPTVVALPAKPAAVALPPLPGTAALPPQPATAALPPQPATAALPPQPATGVSAPELATVACPAQPGTSASPSTSRLGGRSAHPRLARALKYRDEVRAWEVPGGILMLGRGLADRWEVSVEVDPECRGQGLGRELAAAARHLVPDSRPLWAQIAPGNAASVRAFLAAGYRPVGAEALLPLVTAS